MRSVKGVPTGTNKVVVRGGSIETRSMITDPSRVSALTN
jgi:hypothetical protein